MIFCCFCSEKLKEGEDIYIYQFPLWQLISGALAEPPRIHLWRGRFFSLSCFRCGRTWSCCSAASWCYPSSTARPTSTRRTSGTTSRSAATWAPATASTTAGCCRWRASTCAGPSSASSTHTGPTRSTGSSELLSRKPRGPNSLACAVT